MSQRGIQTLFNNFFQDDDSPAPVEKQNKGRSPIHNSKRNECLIDRYFFYGTTHKEWKYSYLLSVLSEEFFLSEVTIPKVVDDNLDKLVELKKMKPEKSFFQNKWPHLVWP